MKPYTISIWRLLASTTISSVIFVYLVLFTSIFPSWLIKPLQPNGIMVTVFLAASVAIVFETVVQTLKEKVRA